MTQPPNKIQVICMPEPMREGEYPTAFIVGQEHASNLRAEPVIITHIWYREQNLGTYGISWYEVYAGDELIASLNAMHVAEVHYEQTGA